MKKMKEIKQTIQDAADFNSAKLKYELGSVTMPQWFCHKLYTQPKQESARHREWENGQHSTFLER